MTDESDTLRYLLEREIENRLKERTGELARDIADEVLSRLKRERIQIVRLHANRRGEDD